MADKNYRLQLDLHNVRRLLHRAYHTNYPSETRLLIQKVLELLQVEGIVGENQLTSSDLPNFDSNTTRRETCPEYWGDARSDKVYFENVYQVKQCDRIPLAQLVELLLYADTCAQGEYMVERVRLVYPNMFIRLALMSRQTCRKMDLVEISHGMRDEGHTWSKLAYAAKTKYVLVGRNMVDFTYYTDIDRMLRVLQDLHVDVVGGAVRLEPEGRWFFGCYQSSIRNFTIRIHPGHDMSAQSCAYCDYIASPFLVKRDKFIYWFTASSMVGVIPFAEFFLKGLYAGYGITHRTVVCVDILFHVQGHVSWRGQGISETPKSAWLDLARKWVINRVVLPGNVDHQWTCAEVNVRCEDFKRPGVVLPGCCIQELATCLKGFLSLAANYNVTAFIVSGTTTGAVKIYGGFLPWERDADVCWDAYKYDIVEGPIAVSLRGSYGCQMGQRVFKTEFGLDIDACGRTTNNSCLYYSLTSTNWFIELYGEPILTSNRLWGLKNPTVISLNGLWVTTVPNPGRAIRHQYGDNILGHIQHWNDLGKSSGWSRYTNVELANFQPCPKDVVSHSCLAGNYLPYGNIQFQDFPL